MEDILCRCSQETCPTCSDRARPARPQTSLGQVPSVGTDVAPEDSGNKDWWGDNIDDEVIGGGPDGDDDEGDC
ncbi:MAG: hypothetical protein AAB473_01290 [Patescibacteria group bacterium]